MTSSKKALKKRKSVKPESPIKDALVLLQTETAYMGPVKNQNIVKSKSTNQLHNGRKLKIKKLERP